MNKLFKIIAPIVVLSATVFVIQALVAAKPQPEKKAEEPRRVSLYVDQVQSKEVTLSVSTQGVVKPKTSVDLVSRVSGHVVSVSDQFAEGAEFEPNTTLIKIDDADYKLEVVRAEAQVAEAKVAVERELANSKIKQKQWSYKHKNAQPTDFALNKPQVAEARAKLKAAEANLKQAQLNVQRTNIRIPFKGYVGNREVSVGQYVSNGTNLGQVFSTDTVEVRLPLTDIQLAELNLPMGYVADDVHQAPVVNFSAKVGQNQSVWQGRIVRTSAAVDEKTRLIYAVAQVVDPYGKGSDGGVPMAVGLFVHAEIEGVNSQQAMMLPRLALRNKDQVYVVNDERLEIRTVTVLSTTPEFVYVSEGLEPGEKVVTSAITTAVDGMQVKTLTRETQKLVSQL